MKTSRPAILGAVAMLLVTGAAYGGYRVNYATMAVPASSYASGQLANARASSNNVERLSCSASALPGYGYASCYARNAAGTSVSCLTDDPGMVNLISSVKGDSELYFEWNPSTGRCTMIMVSNGSSYAPKQP